MTDEIQDYINSVYRVDHDQKKALIESGYNRYIMKEGCLLDDELWVHPDTISAYVSSTPNPKYIFVFKEKYVNDWSSTQSMRRYKKLCKKHIEIINKFHYFTLT